MDRLRYSASGVAGYCAMLLLVVPAIALTLAGGKAGGTLFHAVGPVAGSVVLALLLYGVVVQIVRALMLLARGGTAFAADAQGLLVHTIWVARTFVWPAVQSVTLERRYTRSGFYYVVSIHYAVAGRPRACSARIGMLAASPAEVAAWVDRAEALRLAHGGIPIPPPTGWFAAFTRRRRLSREGIAG